MTRIPALLAFVSLPALVLVLPGVAGQVKPVPGCSEMCSASEINGGELRTGSSSVMTILYAHCEDILNTCVVNAQPTGADDPDIHSGMFMPTARTDVGSCGQPDVCFVNNWFFWESSAGLVERGQDGSKARIHDEPGFADNVRIGPTQPYLFFYMSANPVLGYDDNASPGNLVPADAMPAVGVSVRIETGRASFGGDLVMTADTVTGPDAGPFKGIDGRANLATTAPGQPPIYEFKIPLTVIDPVLKSRAEGGTGFFVSINVYQVKDAAATPNDGWQVTDYQWKMLYGEKAPARIVLELLDPLMTKSKRLDLFDNSLFVRWSFVSPLGSYDTDDRTIRLQIAGPTEPDKTLTRLVLLKRRTGHDGHFFPVNATWRFDYTKAGLADGDYTITMSILNSQGTYQLVEEQTFTVVDGQIEGVTKLGSGKSRMQAQGGSRGDSPGLDGAALLLSLLGSLLFVRFRRKP